MCPIASSPISVIAAVQSHLMVGNRGVSKAIVLITGLEASSWGVGVGRVQAGRGGSFVCRGRG